MKLTTLKIAAIAMLCCFCTTRGFTQSNLHISEKDGSKQTFALNSIRKLTFTQESISVHRNSGGVNTYTISSVAYIGFKPMATATGIAQNTKDDNVIAYPNPTTGEIHVQCSEDILTVNLFDMQGRRLQKVHPKSASTNIDLTQYPSGIYTLQIISNSGVSTKKITKQ